MLGGEKEFLAENHVCRFYRDRLTEDLNAWADGWGLTTVRCLIAEQKKDASDLEYILAEDGAVLYASKVLEEVVVQIDALALSRGLKRR